MTDKKTKASKVDSPEVIAEPVLNFKQRLELELAGLTIKIKAVTAFTSSATYSGLPVKEQNLLLRQRDAMRAYAAILVERLK